MQDLDQMLARLTAEPDHAGLQGIEAAVLARLGEPPRATLGFGIGAVIVLSSLGLGVVSAGSPAITIEAEGQVAPLGLGTALAPSALLAGTR
ncbi:hypothetical protein PK98_01200 [Croceibacterium mercuriale]|uniref:Uncharacterized protein n=1 Tax=Croceibacterium mercuriale TaxID=1572751 RepID=A0A0B2BZS1_9SPHN|nr:hypothetical protein [Croceibacterium mercuriale]KHL25370.1 hypothetical protein PK98_01200 [Croceibacterium mercuriale]